MAMFRPLADRVLVRRDKAEEKTESGLLYKPEKSQDKPQKGTVLATGKGLIDKNGVLHEPRVKRGDRVLFGKYGATEVNVDGETLVVINEGDIFGVIEEE